MFLGVFIARSSEYSLGSTGSAGGLYVFARSALSNAQGSTDINEEENASVDEGQRIKGDKNTLVKKLVKSCKDKLVSQAGGNVIKGDEFFGTLFKACVKIIDDSHGSDGDEAFSVLLGKLDENSIVSLAAARISAKRNSRFIAKALADAFFEEEIAVIQGKMEACMNCKAILYDIAWLLYVKKFANSGGIIDHNAYETFVTKLVGVRAREKPIAKKGFVASILGL